VPVDIFRAIFPCHRRFDPPLDLLGFAPQHGGLVRHADGLQMDVRIEPVGVAALEFIEELLLVAASTI